MLPISDHSSPESQPHKRPPEFSSGKSFCTALTPSLLSLSPQHPRTWILIAIVFIQIVLLCSLRSIPFSFSFYHRLLRDPSPSPHSLTQQALLLTADSLAPQPTPFTESFFNNSIADHQQPSMEHNEGVGEPDQLCASGRIFVYELPKMFNEEVLQNCDNLNPWGSRCDAFANDGLGLPATKLVGVVPDNLVPAWYWTDQFVSEVVFHRRMLNHKCRVSKPESATAFYIPFYVGLAVDKYLWLNTTAKTRDYHCEMMLKWLQDQPYYQRSKGWDHFLTMGRISWDFRRSKNEDWGSSCIYLPGMRNITRLLIERNPWDYFDVGVPYPTGFHPRTDSDVTQWQDFVRHRHRSKLFCFAGAPRREIKNDFRGLLLSHCQNESDSCQLVNCGGTRCSNGTSAILETFLDSKFCLQPRGDSFTRRSIFDCMIAGSIPVFFWRRTAYFQYEWFLPGEPESYSVFIHRDEVKSGTSVRAVLERYSKEEVRKMREKIIEYIPKLVYAKPQQGLEHIKDAFDVAIDGVLSRIKVQREEGYNW